MVLLKTSYISQSLFIYNQLILKCFYQRIAIHVRPISAFFEIIEVSGGDVVFHHAHSREYP